MIDQERWCDAQDYEKLHWARIVRKSKAEGSSLKWYDWKAKQLMKELKPVLDLSRARVLEVGSGPVGIVSFIKGGAKFSVDPLEDFYVRHPALTELRDEDTTYLKGMGEALPFDSNCFDLVILDNVIDHSQDPESVLSEIKRVLVPSGLLYFTVNLHTRVGCFIRLFVEFLRIDRGHPFTFSLAMIRNLLRRGAFEALSEEIEDYTRAKRENISSRKMKRVVKGLIGAAEFQYKSLCRKTGA